MRIVTTEQRIHFNDHLCGCHIEGNGTDRSPYTIKQCDAHKAAPALRRALHSACNALENIAAELPVDIPSTLTTVRDALRLANNDAPFGWSAEAIKKLNQCAGENSFGPRLAEVVFGSTIRAECEAVARARGDVEVTPLAVIIAVTRVEERANQ